MEISKNIFNTGRNMAGDRSYSSIDIIEEPYQKKKKKPMLGGRGWDNTMQKRSPSCFKNSQRTPSLIFRIYLGK